MSASDSSFSAASKRKFALRLLLYHGVALLHRQQPKAIDKPLFTHRLDTFKKKSTLLIFQNTKCQIIIWYFFQTINVNCNVLESSVFEKYIFKMLFLMWIHRMSPKFKCQIRTCNLPNVWVVSRASGKYISAGMLPKCLENTRNKMKHHKKEWINSSFWMMN